MTKPQSFESYESSFKKPLTVEEVEEVVARLRAVGARVINHHGNDLDWADIEGIVEEWQSCSK
jgi:hypothetical protein